MLFSLLVHTGVWEGHFIDLHLCIFFFLIGLNIALHQFEWCVKFFLLYYYLVTHFCFEFWYSHFSSESDVIPGLYFTSRMGFVFENNRYRTMRLLSHPVIIFLCSQFFFKPIFFSNCGNCSGRIHRNIRTCMDRDSEDQQLAHYQGIIMQPIYTCSLQG